MPSPENQWLLIGSSGANCGFGPLRNNVPRSSRGRSPVTGRCGASHSIAIGAKLPASQGERAAAVVLVLPGSVPPVRDDGNCTVVWTVILGSRLAAATSACAMNGAGAALVSRQRAESSPILLRYSRRRE